MWEGQNLCQLQSIPLIGSSWLIGLYSCKSFLLISATNGSRIESRILAQPADLEREGLSGGARKGVIIMWRIRQANNEYICILCGQSIPVGDRYIRPYHYGLDREVSRGVTWRQRRPYFHIECFRRLRGWFGSTVPVYDHNFQEVEA
jgi:hypothetical protein